MGRKFFFLVNHKFLLVVNLWEKCCYKYHCQGVRFSLICGEVVVACLLSVEWDLP